MVLLGAVDRYPWSSRTAIRSGRDADAEFIILSLNNEIRATGYITPLDEVATPGQPKPLALIGVVSARML